MLRPFSLITITQVTPYIYQENGRSVTVTRNSVIVLDFVHSYEIENGWENHTGNATVSFPKNIILQTDKFMFQQSGTYNVILGGTVNGNKVPPLFLRGDKIIIEDGYRFFNEAGKEIKEQTTRFIGFISRVHSEVPIVLDCEDNFYLLKKTPIGITRFPTSNSGSTKMLDLCRIMLANCNKLFGTSLKLFTKTDEVIQNFSLGYLDIDYQTMSCAMVLQKLKQRYGVNSFFVGDELWFCFKVYDEDRANSRNFFEFQNNISSENLDYTNKGDVVVSTVVSCQTIRATNRTTRSGAAATKRFRKSVYVYWDNITETFKYFQIDANHPLPPNEGGERHKTVYGVALTEPEPTVQQMATKGIQELEKYYYTGFRGSFTTLGYPFVVWNDNVNITDKFIADRNGQYKIKKVKYTGGVNGLKQELFLDFKQQIKIPTSTTEISMI